MRRFIALTLILVVLVAIRAEEAVEAKKECKCAEGEENCPCLAQKQEQTAGQIKVKNKMTLNRKQNS
jgi:hypothetical protein